MGIGFCFFWVFTNGKLKRFKLFLKMGIGFCIIEDFYKREGEKK